MLWDEDPRYLDSQALMLTWVLGIGLVLGTVVGFWTGDWSCVIFCAGVIGVSLFISFGWVLIARSVVGTVSLCGRACRRLRVKIQKPKNHWSEPRGR